MKKIVLIALLCLSQFAQAVDLVGVKVPDVVHVGNSNLVLNGVGVRRKFIFDLYVTALYLNTKKFSAASVLNDTGEKRIALYLLDDIRAEDLLYGLQRAMERNNSDDTLLSLKSELFDFDAIGHRMEFLKKGDTLRYDYLPGIGTRIYVNDVLRGTIAGSSLYSVLLSVWLGSDPAQEDLKAKLLGGQ